MMVVRIFSGWFLDDELNVLIFFENVKFSAG